MRFIPYRRPSLSRLCMHASRAHGRESDSSYHFVIGRDLRWAAINSEAMARCFANCHPRSLADAERRRNRPEGVELEEWEYSIQYFGTDKKIQVIISILVTLF